LLGKHQTSKRRDRQWLIEGVPKDIAQNQEHGSGELAMEKLSRQVGTSVTVLRKTYVHFDLGTADWAHIKTLGASGGTTVAA